MLLDDIKRRITKAMRDGNTVEKEILRVALGEIQTVDARGVATNVEETAVLVVKKLIKSDEETLALTEDAARKTTLQQELAVLRSLLPEGLSVPAIVDALAPVRDAVRAAGNDGQATGIAMKHLKAQGAGVAGKDVAEAVRRVRA
jgi:uncharacterized protein YqeY